MENRSTSSRLKNQRLPPPSASTFFIVQQPTGSLSHSSSRKKPKRPEPSPGTALASNNEVVEPTPLPVPADLNVYKQETTVSPPFISSLNRCGSSPELPWSNPPSAQVYSSYQNRSMLLASASSNSSAAFSPSLHRPRLEPLATHTSPSPCAFMSNSNDDEGDAHSLRHQVQLMERQMSTLVKDKRNLEAQVLHLKDYAKDLKSQLRSSLLKVQDTQAENRQHKQAIDKLTGKYASAYSALEKMSSKSPANRPSDHISSTQKTINRLAKENQELIRKLKVLEARHVQDKEVTNRQAIQLREIKAEMEAVRQMNEVDDPSDFVSEHNSSDSPPALLNHEDSKTKLQPPPKSKGTYSPLNTSRSSNCSPSRCPSASLSTTREPSSHQVHSDDVQYIDPSILKVLDKLDPDFNITLAINLSVSIKKWIQACQTIVRSLHAPTVLHSLLQQACSLLKCDHAAVFVVDESSKLLVSHACERGPVQWQFPLDRGFAGFAARQNSICNVKRAYEDARFYSASDSITSMPSRQVLCIPMATASSDKAFAVLQCWNTINGRPFSSTDEILGTLLSHYAASILLQTHVTSSTERSQKKASQILHLFGTLSQSSSQAPGSQLAVVAEAEERLLDILQARAARIFVFTSDQNQTWYIRKEQKDDGEEVIRRRYVTTTSCLCAKAVNNTSELVASGYEILRNVLEAGTYNDAEDLSTGDAGLYLVRIASPVKNTPLGMIEMARTGSKPDSEKKDREKEAAQEAHDQLTLELLQYFCQVLAILLLETDSATLFATSATVIKDEPKKEQRKTESYSRAVQTAEFKMETDSRSSTCEAPVLPVEPLLVETGSQLSAYEDFTPPSEALTLETNPQPNTFGTLIFPVKDATLETDLQTSIPESPILPAEALSLEANSQSDTFETPISPIEVSPLESDMETNSSEGPRIPVEDSSLETDPQLNTCEDLILPDKASSSEISRDTLDEEEQVQEPIPQNEHDEVDTVPVLLEESEQVVKEDDDAILGPLTPAVDNDMLEDTLEEEAYVADTMAAILDQVEQVSENVSPSFEESHPQLPFDQFAEYDDRVATIDMLSTAEYVQDQSMLSPGVEWQTSEEQNWNAWVDANYDPSIDPAYQTYEHGWNEGHPDEYTQDPSYASIPHSEYTTYDHQGWDEESIRAWHAQMGQYGAATEWSEEQTGHYTGWNEADDDDEEDHESTISL